MRHYFRLVAILLTPLLLTSCLVTAGKFESELTVKKDGQFTFAYEGEISVLGMQKLMNVAAKSEEKDFEAICFDESEVEEASYRRTNMIQPIQDTRECTEEEAAEQLKDTKRENSEMLGFFRALFGGIDPSTPEALEEMVKRTRKQKGWEMIEHKGDGIFNVKYLINGQLDYNFSFPHFEQAKGATAFVEIIVHKDNKVRIEAPGFAQLDENNGAMQLGTLATIGSKTKAGSEDFSEEEEEEKEETALPAGFTSPNGSFKITTNAEILTNNTEEGPETEGEMKVLNWKITERTKAPPVTLIKLSE